MRTAPLYRAGRQLLDLVFPPHCVLCEQFLPPPVRGEVFAPFCAGCRRELLDGGQWRCQRCAGSVSQFVAENLPDCPLCRGTLFHFQSIATLGSYQGRLRATVLSTKHASGDARMMALADLLLELRHSWFESQQIDLVVGVPMHWSRRLERGINGPDRLAARLAHHLGAPFRASALKRGRVTRLQGSLGPRERFRNVRGAFVAPKKALVCGRRVLLVDDILTTGATCSEAAHVLQAAGASHVAVAVLTRAQGSR